ncbi:MAG: outer membrane receptor for ferrienterochelin and colicins [Cyclobacteriaceae bacterium]|jgi:outer membrane receptor for ferrienterochelin and colicins
MYSKYLVTVLAALLIASSLSAQETFAISGEVVSDSGPVSFATVYIANSQLGAITDSDGQFTLDNIPKGTHQVVCKVVGYKTQFQTLTIDDSYNPEALIFNLIENTSKLDEVVITGTRTAKKIINSPIIVDVISSQVLVNNQSISLSEGLKFQPGLRIETDCQTCNYTQLRMNGLQGGYSQILINSRPIFSPLTGLYGMEQLPTNMIERIEVVRGGGSALYGTGAIGGTVNIITKIPQENNYSVGYLRQNISGAAEDIWTGNGSLVNSQKDMGISFFVNRRNREWFDANGDNFSELPSIENLSFGTSAFFMPSQQKKIDISLSYINEYRYGGEMIDTPAHLAQQAEERTHKVLVGNVNYEAKLQNGNSAINGYIAAQYTDRDHYTGIRPDEISLDADHLANPPYGTSFNLTLQGGLQFDHNFKNFLGGSNLVTTGIEYVQDDILDEIEAYNFKVDQTTQNLGSFLQSDWEVSDRFNLLSGIRVDQHNFIDGLIASPRISALYRPISNMQLRVTYGTGFRAPQAFDADLHIAFAGGGVSRVILADELERERSRSLSGSVNYDKASDRMIYGFTVEGFYTYLKDAFVLQAIGQDEFGEVFQKENGNGATVAGMTFEARANFDEKLQVDAGLTVQKSEFDHPVVNIDGLEATTEFLRTPNLYGYSMISWTPTPQWNISLNSTYTGPMRLIHFAGAQKRSEDGYVTTQDFLETGLRISYTLPINKLHNKLELFLGGKNLSNAYQANFDSGKNRDSNFVYGPSAPRTIYAGLTIKSW